MASIFTYDPNPPRVSSPWANHSTKPIVKGDFATAKLEAEPQEGPIEYKLHLLLLPRSIAGAPGGPNISGSNHSRIEKSAKSVSGSKSDQHDSFASRSLSEASFTSTQFNYSPARSRQQRLEQLTTQLLWRLQQSSPYHTSNTTKWVPPSFGEGDPASQLVSKPASLIPGLEESKGALYEIGVTDDGTLVGLPEDMMTESVDTLKLMASSLGCTVEILRMVPVGESDQESGTRDIGRPEQGDARQRYSQQSLEKKLWVAEAFVKPDLSLCSSHPGPPEHHDYAFNSGGLLPMTRPQIKTTAAVSHSRSRQLRVSLTGTTMCGKSSLLGTLSTATLDNGRGKSRLSLLKHKHELASGVTSSIAQELIGYHDVAENGSEQNWATEVINFETGNVSSWNDVHDTTGTGRLVLLTDCAGNPRYRRTAIRGLVGWAPHWTLLCIPADDAEDTTGRSGSTPPPEEILGTAAADVDLSSAYLNLCLRLHLPLVVVITKLDLASKQGLRLTLTKVLSALKAAHRKPSILPGSAPPVSEQDLSRITGDVLASAPEITNNLKRSTQETVPIVLTSALKGSGIATLHALLHELPIPEAIDPNPTSHTRRSSILYHVEDEYHPTTRQMSPPSDLLNSDRSTTIIGGHLQRGTISIGDVLTLGPYALDRPAGDAEDSDSIMHARARPNTMTTSRSFPGAFHRNESLRLDVEQEWRRIQVVSVRNLRQPVQSLSAGQVGTLGVVPLSAPISGSALALIRRGMVLTAETPRASRSFVAEFARTDMETLAVGTIVLVYFASVRATAKIIAARLPDDKFEAAARERQQHDTGIDDEEAFGFEMMGDGSGDSSGEEEAATLLVSFRFDHSREYVETGAQVLIMEAGAGLYGGHKRGEKGVVAGLGGLVGTVVGEDYKA